MYSTRRVNKNVVEGGAYITIGDPYQSNKAPAPDRWKGKRLACPVHPPPLSPFTYSSEPVPEAAPAKPQPSEATGKAAGFGFGSRAPNNRDEFALTKRTEAYRETLRKETKLHLKRGGSGKGSSGTSSCSGSTEEPAAGAPRSFMYDIGRGRTTAFNPKLRRDTYYALAQDRAQSPARRLGSHRLTSHDVGQGIWAMEHAPPEFGSLSCTKAFYDASHLHVASPY